MTTTQVLGSSSEQFVVLGFIGGVGSGKSSLAKWISERFTIPVIDGDKLGHAALKRVDVKRQLVEKFGTEIIDSTGEINRSQLGSFVWGETEKAIQARSDLERIVHPIIREAMQIAVDEARQANFAGVILDAAVMIEAGWHNVCHQLIFIDTPDENRLNHVISTRQWTVQQWEERERSQLDLTSKRNKADFIVDNSGTIDQSGQQLSIWLHRQFDWHLTPPQKTN